MRLRNWLALIAVSFLVVAIGTPTSAAPSVSGYWLEGGDGGIFTFGVPFEGSAASDTAQCPVNPPTRSMPNGSCWSMSPTSNGNGYWILNAYSGIIYPYGDAVSYGEPADTAAYSGGADTWPTAIGIVATPDAEGYWVLEQGLSGLGSVQNFGDAVDYGDEPTIADGTAHVGRPVALARTHDGKGYWIVDSDGGVFSFGDATFYGSMEVRVERAGGGHRRHVRRQRLLAGRRRRRRLQLRGRRLRWIHGRHRTGQADCRHCRQRQGSRLLAGGRRWRCLCPWRSPLPWISGWPGSEPPSVCHHKPFPTGRLSGGSSSGIRTLRRVVGKCRRSLVIFIGGVHSQWREGGELCPHTKNAWILFSFMTGPRAVRATAATWLANRQSIRSNVDGTLGLDRCGRGRRICLRMAFGLRSTC